MYVRKIPHKYCTLGICDAQLTSWTVIIDQYGHQIMVFAGREVTAGGLGRNSNGL